jgi:hypothetical protein
MHHAAGQGSAADDAAGDMVSMQQQQQQLCLGDIMCVACNSPSLYAQSHRASPLPTSSSAAAASVVLSSAVQDHSSSSAAMQPTGPGGRGRGRGRGPDMRLLPPGSSYVPYNKREGPGPGAGGGYPPAGMVHAAGEGGMPQSPDHPPAVSVLVGLFGFAVVASACSLLFSACLCCCSCLLTRCCFCTQKLCARHMDACIPHHCTACLSGPDQFVDLLVLFCCCCCCCL